MAACFLFVVAAMFCPGASGDEGGCTLLLSGSRSGVSVWWTERLTPTDDGDDAPER